MASDGNSVDEQPVDSDLSLGFDEFDDMVDYKDTLTLDDEPLFDETWNFRDTSPYDGNLYPSPLSWDAGPNHFPVQETPRIVYPKSTSTLTADQQERLRNIAMPELVRYQNPSPTASSTYKSGSVSSPDQQDNSRKRKTSDDDEEDEDCENGSHPPVKKTAHNMIEKRYRTNLNDKIAALRDSVPSLRVVTKSAKGEGAGGEKEDLQGLTPAHKLNKATVLAKATEYIRHLEKRNAKMNEENATLKTRIAAFEKLFISGAMGVNSSPPTLYPYAQDSYGGSPGSGQMGPEGNSQGMIEVPEEFRRLHAATQLNQQTYQVPQENYQANNRPQRGAGWQNGGGFFGKMMVGSLAGLMILEGFSEAEPSSDSPSAHGLSALPMQLLSNLRHYMSGDLTVLGYHSSAGTALKWILLIGALLYVFMPSLFDEDPKKSSRIINSTTEADGKMLSAAPSPASSIHVRRQAWLTAVQTVWVPRHNFFLEAAAMCLKMIKLSIQNAIGWDSYALITGITEQQEAARVKSWGIALDAQLAGGDVEVSKSRLILTLIASGTLPDTVARLMLKSIHVRILLWEFGNSGFNGFYMFQEFAARLSRWKWNEAKKLHQHLNAHPEARPQDFEPLPDHLVTLLEQECDDVLTDTIGQRAYNLCWNLPTTQNSIGPSDGMDGVVDDHAIRSPLDAVAAWWSSLVLQRALSNSLGPKLDETVAQDIDLAVKTAPIGSGVQLRAIVARAVLLDEKRGANIATALQSLTPDVEGVDMINSGRQQAQMPSLLNTTTSTASLPDLKMSLTCAMAIAHLKRVPASKSAYPIINTIRPLHLSLLGFTAAYKLMETLLEHEDAVLNCSRALENLAGTLRIWVGGREGGKSGLSKETKEKVVEKCIGITKKLIGMERDAGYESMSEREGDVGEACNA